MSRGIAQTCLDIRRSVGYSESDGDLWLGARVEAIDADGRELIDAAACLLASMVNGETKIMVNVDGQWMEGNLDRLSEAMQRARGCPTPKLCRCGCLREESEHDGVLYPFGAID